MSFIRETDYGVLVTEEIMDLLDDSEGRILILQSENIAISQAKKWLSKRYNTVQIFTAWNGSGADTRDAFMVALIIDLAVYHLWTSKAPGRIPETRKQRYQDALDYLKAEGSGSGGLGDLPGKSDEDYVGDFRISSKPPEDHKY